MSVEIELRPYQTAALEDVRKLYRAGKKRVLVVAPTGAGKTVMAASMMRDAGRKQTRTAFLVDRVALVEQTSGVFDRYGIAHGVIQSTHWRDRGYEPVQVCSAQTLESRGFLGDMRFGVNDEAHCIRKLIAERMLADDSTLWLGLTATPFANGMGKLYPDFVNVSTTNKLIAEEFLVPLKAYASVRPDMKGAKPGNDGEWKEKDIEERGIAILGNIVSEWETKTKEHFGGPVKTLVFSASVDHGAMLCEAFNRAGYNFVQISYRDGDASSPERKAIIEEFRKPNSRIDGLISCEILTKGFDDPSVMCIVLARPYRRSFSGHIQQLGRVMRPYPGKEFGLVLCHSGNMLRFLADQERLFENGVTSLEDEHNPDKKKRADDATEEAEKDHRCPRCTSVMPIASPVCPSCGYQRPRRHDIETGAGVMIAIGKGMVTATGKYDYLADKGVVFAQIVDLAMIRKRGDLESARKWALAQYKSIYQEWPVARFEDTHPRTCDPRLAGLVQSKMIANFKRAHAR